jgi:hypothetical protein
MVDMTEQHDVNVQIFHRVKNLNNDVYWSHVADLHGPFPIKEMKWDVNVHDYRLVDIDKCLACNTLWPCATFGIVEERAAVGNDV